MFTERSEIDWKEEHDVLLCREILASQPFKFRARTVEGGKIWDEIAANQLNNCRTLTLYISQIEASTPPPPRAYPGHLTPFPAREGGNLITTHRGGEFDR